MPAKPKVELQRWLVRGVYDRSVLGIPQVGITVEGWGTDITLQGLSGEQRHRLLKRYRQTQDVFDFLRRRTTLLRPRSNRAWAAIFFQALLPSKRCDPQYRANSQKLHSGFRDSSKDLIPALPVPGPIRAIRHFCFVQCVLLYQIRKR